MGLVAFLLFIVLPVAEIYVMVLVADQIGWYWTLLALLGLSLLGVLVVRGTLRAAREIARSTSSMPMTAVPAAGSQAADAGFRLLAGILLVIPGFLTGAVGLLLLLPPVRALARAMAGNAMVRRYPSMQATITRVRIVADPGDVIPGEVIDPNRPPGGPGKSGKGEGEEPPRALP
jgi:UPF0716 protein FxsA